MGLVIFAPTPSFACEKMRLLQTCTHAHTKRFGPTQATLYVHPIYRTRECFYFILFSLTHLYVHYLRLPFLFFLECVIAAARLACEALGILLY